MSIDNLKVILAGRLYILAGSPKIWREDPIFTLELTLTHSAFLRVRVLVSRHSLTRKTSIALLAGQPGLIPASDGDLNLEPAFPPYLTARFFDEHPDLIDRLPLT